MPTFAHHNPLHELRRFFQPGRNRHGGMMGEDEDVINASYRNLSCHTDQELDSLKEACRQFTVMIEDTMAEREVPA